MIYRPDYINAISTFIDAPLVKILAGVRRCGKSTILEMMKEELVKRSIAKENIISRKYNEMDVDDKFTAKDMYCELKNAIDGKGRCYLFLDELQEVDGWEKVVNSLLEGSDVDIYVTGSNSKLMSSEISTYLSGRYVSIPVYTLSFNEYLQFKGKAVSNAKDLIDEYIQFGGFPVGIGNPVGYRVIPRHGSIDFSVPPDICRQIAVFQIVCKYPYRTARNIFSLVHPGLHRTGKHRRSIFLL